MNSLSSKQQLLHLLQIQPLELHQEFSAMAKTPDAEIGVLPEAVAAGHLGGPVGVGQLAVARHVEQEGLARARLADRRTQAAGVGLQLRAAAFERIPYGGFVPATGQGQQARMPDGQRPAHGCQQQRPVGLRQPALQRRFRSALECKT